jgi:hypothetical protein
MTVKSIGRDKNNVDILVQDLVDFESGVLVKPKAPSDCPLFCCFYAEFDIKKGPVIRHQCPKNFMEQDINTITTYDIHEILAKTFVELAKGTGNTTSNSSKERNTERLYRDEDVARGGDETMDFRESSKNLNEGKNNGEASTKYEKPEVLTDTTTQEEKFEVGELDEFSRLQDGGQSIFDSTSEYIITGSELTGKVITLSTHDMHVMTRPTQISDERYERNALLFSVGFVLRRAADPRPFRPLISKLAMALRSMEIESGVLSAPSKQNKIQSLLEKILISMNSPKWECNLLLDKCTALNLKLFHSPKPQTAPVHEYQVPVLLRRDPQLQLYEWDLAINWVVLHIDGITNARQISIKAEVDLEMVLACLRVLKHHGVIQVVDMFMYTNRYEFTEKATAMLAGKEDKLLQEAVAFAIKRPTIHTPSVHNLLATDATANIGTGAGSTASVGSDAGHTGSSPLAGSPYLSNIVLAGTTIPSSSYPPFTLNLLAAGGSQRSTNFRFAMIAANSLERETVDMGCQPEDRGILKGALAELYCACNRKWSFGDLWLSLTCETSKGRHGTTSRTSLMPARIQRNGRNCRDSTTDMDASENNDVIVSSPMEASILDAMKRNRSASVPEEPTNDSTTNNKYTKSSLPDWKSIFKDFDHRRFITFGIVHGLLTRVHAFPFFSGSSFPDKRVDFQGSSVVLDSSELSSRQPKNFRHEMNEEKNFQLAKALCAAMDGTRCDDEIVCNFELPLNKIVELVEKYSGKKVMFIYSTH